MFLNLQGNGITDEGLGYLAKGFKYAGSTCTLKVLNIA